MVKILLDIFSLRMRRNGYLGAIRSGDLDFLYDGYTSIIRWRLRHIFDVLCTISFHLVTFTFDLLTLAASDELRAWHVQHTNKFLAPYGYPFLSYVWLNLITLQSPGTVTAHAPCHETYQRGQKLSTFFKNSWPQFTYTVFTLSLSRSSDED